MKIVNSTTRDATLPFQTTFVSELTFTSNLYDNSLIHIVEEVSSGNYESKRMLARDFKQKIYEAVQNTLSTAYWDTHCNSSETTHQKYPETANAPSGTSFKELVDYLKNKRYAPVEVSHKAVNGFVNHVYYDFDVLKRYVVLRDGDLQDEIDDINDELMWLDCMFAPTMQFHTTRKDSNENISETSNSVNHTGNDNYNYCQMEIKPGNKISNEWTCTASGNLVVYGWLDAEDALNNKATPSAFCVIEAKIAAKSDGSSNATTSDPEWEIIGVQPVNPAKTMTYVGFNLIVRKNLVIRARTGFTCGAKSSQYANAQDGYDTLSTSVPNGFKCMIYSNRNYNTGRDNWTL